MSSTNIQPKWDLVLETDGSTKRANHRGVGPSSWGFVALTPWMDVIYEDCGLCGMMNSNQAEYRAVWEALKFARDLNYPRKIQVRSDSTTLVNQMSRGFGLTEQGVSHPSSKVALVALGFDEVTYIWTPRMYNHHADRLANAAFSQYPIREIRKIDRKEFDQLPKGWCDEGEYNR